MCYFNHSYGDTSFEKKKAEQKVFRENPVILFKNKKPQTAKKNKRYHPSKSRKKRNDN